MSGNGEAENVDQIVLVSQFISSLRSGLQAKVAGIESGMDEIVTKAWFQKSEMERDSWTGCRNATRGLLD